MSGITSGTGIFSGINSAQLIQQLLQIEARPQQLAQQRAVQVQAQQAVFLDLASKVTSFKSLAATFKTSKVFQSLAAASSNQDVLTATADTTASPGSYQFIVDRLVSTQQYLSRGFANRDSAAIGMTSMTVESARGRLDKDIALSDLNGGEGITRGRIVITASTGSPVTVDLSRSATINDVLESINGSGAAVTASVRDGKLVVKDTAGGVVRVDNGTGSTTATQLGIAGVGSGVTGELVGSTIYHLGDATALSVFNDGNGVDVKAATGVGAYNFKINIDRGSGSTEVRVNLGDIYSDSTTITEGAVTTVAGAIDRMNDALEAAGFNDVNAQISSDGTRLELVDSNGPTTTITVAENTGTTAKDLGLLGTTSTSTLTGKKVLAGMNSTLLASLNGGSGITGDGVLNFTMRSGTTFNVTIDTAASLDSVIRQIEDASRATPTGPNRVSVTLNAKGTGLTVTDNTGSTTSNLIITGTSGSDTATSLGISTGASGVASTTVDGTNLQKRYLGRATLLTDMDNGKGVGTGRFRITDSTGATALVELFATDKTLGDVIDKINSRGLAITARINANGDGLEIIENSGTNGSTKLKVVDESGSAAKSLNILGEATGTGASNKLNGSYERTITFAATDTLQQVVTKINAARGGVSASIIRDGNGSAPYKLAFSAEATGSAGRMILDAGSFDLGLTSIDQGMDARVFFGSSDPARGILVTSSSNTLDNVVSGVRIDLKATSATPVQLTISRDSATVEAKIDEFLASFNEMIDRIDAQSKYDTKTKKAGILLGDSTAQTLRREMYRVVQAKTIGNVGRYDDLADVGISVGRDGDLTVNKTRLRAAIAEDPAAVDALFNAKTLRERDTTNPNAPATPDEYTQLGILGQIDNVTKRYENSTDGVLVLKRKTLEALQTSLQKRIDDFDIRLEARRVILSRQFTSMEQTIGNLQSQQGFLSSLG